MDICPPLRDRFKIPRAAAKKQKQALRARLGLLLSLQQLRGTMGRCFPFNSGAVFPGQCGENRGEDERSVYFYDVPGGYRNEDDFSRIQRVLCFCEAVGGEGDFCRPSRQDLYF
jgi:hypothetical protein